MSKETATARKTVDSLRKQYELAIEFRPEPDDFKTVWAFKEGEAEYEMNVLDPLRDELRAAMQPIVEEEFAYTSWTDSCQASYFDRNCRRPRGHEGHHASGLGTNYTIWGVFTLDDPYGRSV